MQEQREELQGEGAQGEVLRPNMDDDDDIERDDEEDGYDEGEYGDVSGFVHDVYFNNGLDG